MLLEPVLSGAVLCVPPLGTVEPLKLAALEFVAVAITAEPTVDVAAEFPESVSVQAVKTSPVGF